LTLELHFFSPFLGIMGYNYPWISFKNCNSIFSYFWSPLWSAFSILTAFILFLIFILKKNEFLGNNPKLGYDIIDGNISSVFYRELQNIYCKCHNHRHIYRRIQSVGISPRVKKYLLHMPQSPTEYFCRYISNENFFLAHMFRL